MATKSKIANNLSLGYFPGKIPISFRYTHGVAGETFFRKIMEGKIVGSYAEESDTVYCPPRIFCEDSFEAIDELLELPSKGTVETFTVCFEDMSGNPIEPVVLAFVNIDGTDGGIAAPLRCELEDAQIGMRVKVEFLPKKDRKGSINDIYFVPEK